MAKDKEPLKATLDLLPALRAICAIAGSNFPAPTDLRISADGAKATGSILVSHYVLQDLLDKLEIGRGP